MELYSEKGSHPGETFGAGFSHAVNVTTGKAPSWAWKGHLF